MKKKVKKVCGKCKGTGKVDDEKCNVCNGVGYVYRYTKT